MGFLSRKNGLVIDMTIIVDDAGSGDLLFGVVIGAYREETGEFKYDLISVKFFQKIFVEKKYLQESSLITSKLISALKPRPDEEIQVEISPILQSCDPRGGSDR